MLDSDHFKPKKFDTANIASVQTSWAGRKTRIFFWYKIYGRLYLETAVPFFNFICAPANNTWSPSFGIKLVQSNSVAR